MVAKNEPFNGGLVAVNSFGFGGANAHILLKCNPKPKTTWPPGAIPRLVAVSGRTEDAVNHLLDKALEHGNDEEFLALLDEIHARNVTGHGYRGYATVGKSSVREVASVSVDARPVWYVFTGMGSQWPGMAKQLMQLDVFRNSIRKSAEVLKKHGINLEEVIINGDETAFENVLNSFISIAAVQIALTDVLKSLGVEPDGIVGHSVGEVGKLEIVTFGRRRLQGFFFFKGARMRTAVSPPSNPSWPPSPEAGP